MAYTTFSADEKRSAAGTYVFLASRLTWPATISKKYDIFEKLIEKQLSFFWRPEEVDVPAIASTTRRCRNMKTYFSSAT